MVFRVSILDLAAAALVAIAFLIPAREFLIEPAYADVAPTELRIVAQAQRKLEENPGDGAAAARLADALRRMDQHQAALRVAGDALAHGGGWRAALAVSSIHADRVEVADAYTYAKKALEECDADPPQCPSYERLRMSIYHDGLRSGLESGVDPRLEPQRFRDEVMKTLRTVRFRGQ